MTRVSDLEAYLEDTSEWMTGLLDSLHWTAESVLQTEDYIVCSENTNHFVPVDKLDHHVKYCSAARQGYTKSDLCRDKSSDFFYEKATKVVPIKLSEDMLVGIIASIRGPCGYDVLPKTMDRYLSHITREERLKIYDYCVECARTAHSLRVSEDDLMLLSEATRRGAPPQEKSRLEILAEERNQRRRRQSYKGKKVHSGKKSHLEVLKEVIDNQMEILQQMWDEDKATEERLNAKNIDKRDQRQNSPTGSSYSRRSDRHRDNYTSRGPSLSRDRDFRSRTRHRDDQDRDSNRDRSRDRNSNRDRSRDRDSRKYRSKDRDWYRDRSKDRDLYRERSKDRNSHRDRSRDRDSYRNRDENKSKYRDEKTVDRETSSKARKTDIKTTESFQVKEDSNNSTGIGHQTSKDVSSRTNSKSRSRSRSKSHSRSRRRKKKKRKSDRSDHKKKKKHKSKD